MLQDNPFKLAGLRRCPRCKSCPTAPPVAIDAAANSSSILFQVEAVWYGRSTSKLGQQIPQCLFPDPRFLRCRSQKDQRPQGHDAGSGQTLPGHGSAVANHVVYLYLYWDWEFSTRSRLGRKISYGQAPRMESRTRQQGQIPT